uniref:Tc1-like transposase DDE domain-containing protein n=1 Tax=Phytophthora ramorum TaxID=164328 RepID=H3GWB2_PHYRM
MPRTPHPASARARLLDAYRSGDDWMLVAAHNGIPPTSARRIVDGGHVELRPRGGARSSCTKCTPEIDNCTYTLSAMRDMVRFDFGVDLSTSTISNKLIGKVYTIKQPMTCNNNANKEKRKTFAKALRQHMAAGDFIVYYDETNFNVYCKRSQGRAKKGKRATVILPPSKRANLQIQCAVSTEVGLVHYRLEKGSIHMDVNAGFVDEIYDKVKSPITYVEHFQGKKVVVVLDNAPAHSQTEERVEEHDDLSPMCNPIEGCFSVLKAKVDLALSREELVAIRPRGTIAAARMAILKRAAKRCIDCMDLRLVNKMALHCQHAVAAAERLENMQYGT